ncbi:MAG: transposase [Candidatus Adiutrix intracellularis]|nr:transposase [Candidatus Adiutrix intracellularis]
MDLEIIEVEYCPNYIHMFVRISLKYNISEIMGYLKEESLLMIFDQVC